ncbi:multicopper oxidase domain-containing protein [Otariodibacter sp.]|uniref:multicopper oxidase domain-containing protein n=1 Tax=Otariodibacter sp. TaxID=3030919 RepID=UPI002604CF77|nr:multicopper oxidase domain-containing protein [Otariodibacter sp.]
MQISRRQFLKRSALASIMGALPQALWAESRHPLHIPPIIDIGRGRPVRLDFRPSQTQFNQGKLVDVWGVNGRYLAPTVRVKSGDFVRLTYINNLPQPLSINLQGILASTEMTGSIHHKLSPKSSWSPILEVKQSAGTAWYHSNTMLNSAFQVYRGLVGLWIIEDNKNHSTTIPNKYGINDIPLILQDQLINNAGKQVIDADKKQFFGNRVFVNGQESPYLEVSRGWVRFRIVNASLSRRYELRLDNGQPLYLIGTGVGYLQSPVEMSSVHIAPSERVELLANLNEGKTISLITGESRGILYKVGQLFSKDDDLVDNVILELRLQGLPAVFDSTMTLPTFDLEDFTLKINNERRFMIMPFDRVINKQRFDPKRIDFEAKQGTVERWYLQSDQDIGFTLQGAKFIIETENGEPYPRKQLAWRDTVWLEKDQIVTILVRFEHLASDSAPFTFGVSDFMLRDRGCMGQFSVK